MSGRRIADLLRRSPLRGIWLAMALSSSIACGRCGPKSSTSAASGIVGLPRSLRIEQRSTVAVPGSEEALFITIDDITRNQVLTTLVRHDKSPLLGPISLVPGTKTPFEHASKLYFLELVGFDTSTIGSDFANFTVSDRAESEAARIESLLGRIAAARDIRFIRSGEEYGGDEAAAHLRRKLSSVDASKWTAEEFIDNLASRSSLTGDEYRIRLPDGTTLPAAEYFRRELALLAQTPVADVR